MNYSSLKLLIVSGMLAVSPSVHAQGLLPSNTQEAVNGGDQAATLVSRFYDITPLVVPQQQFPFDADSGNRAGAAYATGGPVGAGGFLGGGGYGGGFGGGVSGGGGGQGGTGGGFFSLPYEPAQYAGGGGHGGGGIGGMAGPRQPGSELSFREHLENSGGITISHLIENHIAPDSWSSSGGPGQISDIGRSLLITQTEQVHSLVNKFLEELVETVVGSGTYHLEAWWLPIDEEARKQVLQLISGDSDEAAISEHLNSLGNSTGGYHGTMLVRERVTTHTASGHQVPVVVGLVPVVGGGSGTGVQPIVRTLHLGLMLEAQLSPIPSYLSSAAGDPEIQQMELSYRSAITDRGDVGKEWPTDEKIDRYTLGKSVAEGSCQIRLGRATLLASLSDLSSAVRNESEIPSELMLIVRVSRNTD